MFDPEGKYLYYLSDRDFNEVLGNVDFEFANPKTTRVYIVTLKKDEPSSLGVQSDEIVVKTAELVQMSMLQTVVTDAVDKKAVKKEAAKAETTDEGKDKDKEKKK